MGKYNLTEKKDKPAAYRTMIRAKLLDDLYEKILHKLVVDKIYRDPTYTAKKLADELQTNSRYISAVVNLRFHQNYPTLINDYRVREAMFMLIDKRYKGKTVEEISALVGFSNRQSFYAAFYRSQGITPADYRRSHKPSEEKK